MTTEQLWSVGHNEPSVYFPNIGGVKRKPFTSSLDKSFLVFIYIYINIPVKNLPEISTGCDSYRKKELFSKYHDRG